MSVLHDLKGTRKQLALVAADGRWRTANELAHGVGKPTGAIFGVLGRMRGDALFESDAEPPTRGTQYRLTRAGEAALSEALAREQPVGHLNLGQWLVTVERSAKRSRLSDFERVIATTSLSGAIVWSVSFGWGWLLAFGPEADEFDASRLVIELEKAGFRCRDAQAQALVSGTQLRERSATLVKGDKR